MYVYTSCIIKVWHKDIYASVQQKAFHFSIDHCLYKKNNVPCFISFSNTFIFLGKCLFLTIFRISPGLPNVTDYTNNDINLYKYNKSNKIFIHLESPNFFVGYIQFFQFIQFIHETLHTL